MPGTPCWSTRRSSHSRCQRRLPGVSAPTPMPSTSTISGAAIWARHHHLMLTFVAITHPPGALHACGGSVPTQVHGGFVRYSRAQRRSLYAFLSCRSIEEMRQRLFHSPLFPLLLKLSLLSFVPHPFRLSSIHSRLGDNIRRVVALSLSLPLQSNHGIQLLNTCNRPRQRPRG